MNVNRLKTDADIRLLCYDRKNQLLININYEVELYIDLDNDENHIGFIMDDNGNPVDSLHRYSESYLDEAPFTWLKTEIDDQAWLEPDIEYQREIKPMFVRDLETQKIRVKKLFDELETQLFSKPIEHNILKPTIYNNTEEVSK